MGAQPHNFVIAASRHWLISQWLGLLLLSLTALAWPSDLPFIIYLLFTLILGTILMVRCWQLWRFRAWQQRFSLNAQGQGFYYWMPAPSSPLAPANLHEHNQVMASDNLSLKMQLAFRPWVCPWFCCFAIDTQQGRVWLWVCADMLSMPEYRDLCRLLLNYKKAPAGA
ncbi:hypothetical protein FJQ87_06015 [Shewanella sp. SNU WT4]|uniref:protein YgfX n=1 Tax=Shewanella sp. SNU WT4 TaxID=2590015 RepID=UPI0011266D67|nr:protein YgfX [Shewanella sp. SNU WT4]QDF66306.1 hypothetical protein FJQ87_06015 [Shewanella sp. SNU WT4]